MTSDLTVEHLADSSQVLPDVDVIVKRLIPKSKVQGWPAPPCVSLRVSKKSRDRHGVQLDDVAAGHG